MGAFLGPVRGPDAVVQRFQESRGFREERGSDNHGDDGGEPTDGFQHEWRLLDSHEQLENVHGQEVVESKDDEEVQEFEAVHGKRDKGYVVRILLDFPIRRSGISLPEPSPLTLSKTLLPSQSHIPGKTLLEPKNPNPRTIPQTSAKPHKQGTDGENKS